MKTKVLFAAVAVAFSFAVTSCGNKKLLMPMLPEQTLVALHKQNRYVTLQRLAARLILPFVRKADCPEAACDSAKCDKPCEKK